MRIEKQFPDMAGLLPALPAGDWTGRGMNERIGACGHELESAKPARVAECQACTARLIEQVVPLAIVEELRGQRAQLERSMRRRNPVLAAMLWGGGWQ